MTVRDLVEDLFAAHLDRLTTDPVRLQALVALMEDVGVAEPTTRVTMAALRRDGAFAALRTGRETVYRPTDQQRAVRRGVEERLAQRLQPWDGRWRMVIYSVPETDRAARERVRRTLARHGFGMLAAATWISAQEAALEEVRAALATEPLSRLDVLRASLADADLPAGDPELAARCWDLTALAAEYRELGGELRRLLAAQPVGAAALWAHLHVRRERRALLARDPVLPPELRPGRWPGQDASQLWDDIEGPLSRAAHEHVAARLREHGDTAGDQPGRTGEHLLR